MPSTYDAFRLTIPTKFHEIAIAYLSQLPFESIEEDTNQLTLYAVEGALSEKEIKSHLPSSIVFFQDVAITHEVIAPTNWNETWEKDFKPISITEDCVIRAHFHQPIGKKYEIIITPKMSFGTGHHATTRLMMRHMFDYNFADKAVLDMGTGTGVLAILAEILGSKNITAIDNFDWAVENTQENIQLNNCANINAYLGDTESLTTITSQDIILANINRNVLLEQMGNYAKCIERGGLLLISGFFVEYEDELKEAASQHDFWYLCSKIEDNWSALVFRKGKE